ncbi:MAG: hypothetical protein K0R67_2348 [Paenibacillus sp.]|jgi:hypothetical protein|nr:hypothetical protein [Paenibacillus sp.]
MSAVQADKRTVTQGSGGRLVGGWAKMGRILFLGIAVIFAVCVTLQVFLAGLSVFVDPGNWAKHRTFVHFIEFVPFLMLIAGFTGRVGRALLWQSFALFAMIFIMYFTANFTSIVPEVGALHPVIALVLFWLSIRVVWKAWHLIGGGQLR